jgi:hypothetical protein
MSRSRTERARLARLFAVAALGTSLAGCADFYAPREGDSYLDHRDTLSPHGGDAVDGNTITQMVDPWPAYSGDRNIAFNGQKMQGAVERYRTGKVIQPVDPEEATTSNASGQTVSTTVNTGGAAPAASSTTPSQ